jgi:hypothetical protein
MALLDVPIEGIGIACRAPRQFVRSAVARTKIAFTPGKIGKPVYTDADEEQSITFDPRRTVFVEISIAAPQCLRTSAMFLNMRDDRRPNQDQQFWLLERLILSSVQPGGL